MNKKKSKTYTLLSFGYNFISFGTQTINI